MRQRRTLVALALMLLPILAFYYPVWGQGKNAIPADTITGLYHPFRDAFAEEYPNGTPYKNFLITDAVRQQYVWRQFSIEQLQQGQIPWWNPYNFSGTPHIANFQSASFYPLNVVFWLMDFTSGWNLLVISQSILGAVFMYLFLRHSHKLHYLAAVTGGLTWIFSGFFIAWLEWNTAVHVAVWSPLILLALDALLEQYRINLTTTKKHQPISKQSIWLWTGILAFGLVSQFYSGYPQPWLYLSLLQVGYGLWRFISVFKTNPKLKISGLAPIVAGYIIFAILAWPQLKLTLEFSALSNRVNDQGNVLEKADWFLPSPQLIQLIVPDFFGNPTTRNYWGEFNYTEFVGFIGIVPMVLVLTSLINSTQKKNKHTRVILFFMGMVILSLVCALRNPISEAQFKYNLPFLGASQPSRWLVVTDISLAILSAFGMEAFLKKKRMRFAAVGIMGLLLGSLWLLVLKPQLIGWFELQQNQLTAKRNLILPTLEFGFIIGVLIANQISRFQNLKSLKLVRYLPQVCALGMIGVISFSGYRFGNKFVAFSNPEFLYPQTQTTDFLKEHSGLYRYMTQDRRVMAPNFNLAYDLYTIEGYDPLYLFDYSRLIYATEHANQEYRDNSKPFNRIVTSDYINSRILDLLGVKYIVTVNWLSQEELTLVMTEGATRLYENTEVFPRAFVTHVDGDYLEVTPDEPVQIVEYSPNRVKMDLNITQPGFLILTDAYHPDWTASINGQPAVIENWYGLRRLPVEAGQHEVIYQYRYSYL